MINEKALDTYRHYSADQKDAVRSFLNALDLRVPKEKESYTGTCHRNLVFLNDCGLVIRITPEDQLLGFDNPHFLKPLFTRHAQGLQFAIDPGIDCPVELDAMQKIYKYLELNHGISVAQGIKHNLGYLPDGGSFPVMIDLDRSIYKRNDILNRLSAAAREARKAIGKEPEILQQARQAREAIGMDPITLQNGENPQDRLYGALRDKMARAWPEDMTMPDKLSIQDFFETCRKYKAEGKLLTRWKSANYFGTSCAAENYHARRIATGNLPECVAG